MPSRLLREGILASERVEQLNSEQEVFYRRLMSKVDDHGLYDARLSILRTSLYPLRVDRVQELDIKSWLEACATARLLQTYEVNGQPYLKMLDTGWDKRSKPKYPFPVENSRLDLPKDVYPVVVVDVVVGDVCTEDRKAVSAPVAHLPLVDGTEFEVHAADIEGWRKAFPAVDVRGQLLRMREWLLSNPRKRKTRKGVRRFITDWLGRDQDRGAGKRDDAPMPSYT